MAEPTRGRPPQKKRRWPKRIGYVLFGLVLFIVFLSYGLPFERLILSLAEVPYETDGSTYRIPNVFDSGLTLEVASLRPRYVLWLRSRDVRIETVSREADGPLAVAEMERIDARLELFPLLSGERRIAFSSDLYDGSLKGVVGIAEKKNDLVLDWEGIDLELYELRKRMPGYDLRGLTSGRADLRAGMTFPSSLNGDVRIGLSDGSVLFPQARIALPIKRLDAELTIEDGVATIRHCEATSLSAQINVAGTVKLGRTSDTTVLNLRFMIDTGTSRWLDQLIIEACPKRRPDGVFECRITGPLTRPSFR